LPNSTGKVSPLPALPKNGNDSVGTK
jgi:hypothetical protein